MTQESKTLIKASIRNIDIHLLQLGPKKFQAVWCKQDTPIEEIKDRKTFIETTTKFPFLNPFWKPVALSTATRRFKQMCRVAQDPRVNFETIEQ